MSTAIGLWPFPQKRPGGLADQPDYFMDLPAGSFEQSNRSLAVSPETAWRVRRRTRLQIPLVGRYPAGRPGTPGYTPPACTPVVQCREYAARARQRAGSPRHAPGFGTFGTGARAGFRPDGRKQRVSWGPDSANPAPQGCRIQLSNQGGHPWLAHGTESGDEVGGAVDGTDW